MACQRDHWKKLSRKWRVYLMNWWRYIFLFHKRVARQADDDTYFYSVWFHKAELLDKTDLSSLIESKWHHFRRKRSLDQIIRSGDMCKAANTTVHYCMNWPLQCHVPKRCCALPTHPPGREFRDRHLPLAIVPSRKSRSDNVDSLLKLYLGSDHLM